MKEINIPKESYKRYQKWQQNWCNLMASKYYGKKVEMDEVWSEAAVAMGYQKKFIDFFLKQKEQFIGYDKDMIFFKLLDNTSGLENKLK